MEAYKEMKDKELQDRETVLKCYDKVIIKPFNNPHIRYDYHTCSTCSNYTYLSYISCMTCKKAGCTHHVTVCNCLNTKMVLNTRFSEKVEFFVVKKMLKNLGIDRNLFRD